MEPVVSVIIPNYNAEPYVLDCIKSVINQTYNNLEIIVVDDGSTDLSLSKVKVLATKYDNIIVYQQENLNASIARNRGVELSNGKYILFLDSDDILYREGISCLVKTAEEGSADLVIGNYNNIGKDGNIVRKCDVVKESIVSTKSMDFVGMVPNPSNKLYSKKIIDENRIIWGNVRIGQDLNFFLKYLSCCKVVLTTTEYIYGWRIVDGSISNSFNFRIFDITESFKNTRNFYLQIGKKNIYEEYVSAVEYRHYYLQMEKQKYFKNRKERKLVADYFCLMLAQIDLSHCKIIEWYKSDLRKCKYKIMLKSLYISKLYTWLDAKFARKTER